MARPAARRRLVVGVPLLLRWARLLLDEHPLPDMPCGLPLLLGLDVRALHRSIALVNQPGSVVLRYERIYLGVPDDEPSETPCRDDGMKSSGVDRPPARRVAPSLWPDRSTSITTPPRPSTRRCWTRCCRIFTEHFGNPSSEHAYGWAADEAVKQAREQLAAPPRRAARRAHVHERRDRGHRLAIRGTAAAYRREEAPRRHRRHRAQSRARPVLVAEARRLPRHRPPRASRDGRLDLDATPRRAHRHDAPRRSDVGQQRDGRRAADPPRSPRSRASAGALMMTDATQAVGKIPVHVDARRGPPRLLGRTSSTGRRASARCIVRRRGPRVRLAAADHGRRAGGRPPRAARSTCPASSAWAWRPTSRGENIDADAIRMAALRDRFEARLLEAVPTRASTAPSRTAPAQHRRTSSFRRHRAASCSPALRDVAASVGAACQSPHSSPATSSPRWASSRRVVLDASLLPRPLHDRGGDRPCRPTPSPTPWLPLRADRRARNPLWNIVNRVAESDITSTTSQPVGRQPVATFDLAPFLIAASSSASATSARR